MFYPNLSLPLDRARTCYRANLRLQTELDLRHYVKVRSKEIVCQLEGSLDLVGLLPAASTWDLERLVGAQARGLIELLEEELWLGFAHVSPQPNLEESASSGYLEDDQLPSLMVAGAIVSLYRARLSDGWGALMGSRRALALAS